MKLLQLLENGPTDNPNFQRWFGDSKVVNDQGEPLIVYHGTNQDFDTFKGMVWASAGKDLPQDYAAMRAEFDGGNASIMPLYMRITKPFNADYLPKTVTVSDVFMAMLEQAGIDETNIPEAIRVKMSELLEIVQSARREEGSGPHYSRHDFWNSTSMLFGRKGADAIQQAFLLTGYDGVQMIEGGELTFGAFNPNQAKSAFNKGGYNPDDPNVSEDDDMRMNQFTTEAPIGDYATIGNWGDQEKSNSFNHAQDRKMIQSDNLVKKVRKKFGNTEHILNFYFVNLPGAKKNAESGVLPAEEIERRMPQAWQAIQQREQEQGTDASSSINVVYVGNAGFQRVPMTAWIMAHRLGHSLYRTQPWKDFVDDITETFQGIFQNVYEINTRRDRNGGFSNIDDKSLAAFYEEIGSMASARNKKLGGRPYEFYYELFAQYVTTGKITMRPLPKVWGTPRGRQYRSVDEETREYYSDDLTFDGYSIVDQWGECADTVLYGATGKYLVM